MSKWDPWISEDGLIKVQGWARDGLTDIQIANNMGISEATLYGWKNKFPEFAEALRKGKEVVDREVENALYKSAMGYEYEETRIETCGKQKKTITIKKHMAPNVTAQIFWLKCRKPGDWKEKNEVTITPSNGVLESLMELNRGKADVES